MQRLVSSQKIQPQTLFIDLLFQLLLTEKFMLLCRMLAQFFNRVCKANDKRFFSTQFELLKPNRRTIKNKSLLRFQRRNIFIPFLQNERKAKHLNEQGVFVNLITFQSREKWKVPKPTKKRIVFYLMPPSLPPGLLNLLKRLKGLKPTEWKKKKTNLKK